MGRSPCCEKNGLKKGPWTPEEDQKLVDYIQKHGYGNWRTLPKNAGLQRCGKSCRLRWTNYLRPDIKRGRFSFEEEEAIIQLHSILGNKWSAIAARLPGRTDNEIKNYWNTHIRKRLLRMGIDPVTHSPRLDLLDLSAILGYSSSSSAFSSSQQQPNFSRLLGVQSLINPEILRLANSILSSSTTPQTQSTYHQPESTQTQTQNQTFLTPDQQIQYQPEPVQPVCSEFQEMTANCTTTNTTTTAMENTPRVQFSDVDVVPTVWQSNYMDGGGYDIQHDYFYGPGQHDQTGGGLVDPSTTAESCFGFPPASVLSTPSSSPTPLNSNSTYNNLSTEDERDSYCSNVLLFDMMADSILDVGNFM
ncbi:unnamed protein product [Linum tenue]|uniref:Uncharacterized protein n=1 Tax=Linum tenue TaxID=586396 RepID=A0AAV0PAN0_9ROSI|nr:unnamed protein product [Linum tenue]CAI0467855.1 unnamed protein product [Linum tenue]